MLFYRHNTDKDLTVVRVFLTLGINPESRNRLVTPNQSGSWAQTVNTSASMDFTTSTNQEKISLMSHHYSIINHSRIIRNNN